MTHRHSSSDNKSQIVGVAFLSAVIGAVTALLMAPKAGNDTRKSLTDRIKSLGKQVKAIDVESKPKTRQVRRSAVKATSAIKATAKRAADKTKV